MHTTAGPPGRLAVGPYEQPEAVLGPHELLDGARTDDLVHALGHLFLRPLVTACADRHIMARLDQAARFR